MEEDYTELLHELSATKPNIRNDGRLYCGICGNCIKKKDYGKIKYCKWCEQKIDWSGYANEK
jgi:uncharacterized CHY-type Zn-finger protein